MMPARLRLYKHLALSASVALSGLACNADFSGFDDLLDPAATFVNFPGRQITNLNARLPFVEGTDSAGGMFVTVEIGTGRLLVFPFEGGPPCSPSKVDRVGYFPFGLRSELTPYFPVVEPATSERDARLRFVGPRCAEPLAPIAGALLPYREAFADPPGFLTPTADGKLLFVEPWTRKKRTVAEGVERRALLGDFSSSDPDDAHVWTIEQGEIVGRNRAFEEFARFGERVIDWAIWAGPERIAYVEAPEPGAEPDPEATVKGGSLYLVDIKAGTEPELIDEDACEVDFPSGWAGAGLSFFSPCAERRLVLHDIAHSREEDGEYRFELRTQALPKPIIDRLTKPYVFFFTGEDPEARYATLWGGRLGGTMQRLSDYASTERAPFATGSSFQILIDRDHHEGAFDTDTLVDWEPGTAPKVLLEDVRQLPRPFALAHYDGAVGEAYLVDTSGRTRRLAEGVPRDGIVFDDVGTAILKDYADGAGTLVAAAEKSLDFEVVARRVARGTFHFIPDIGAIGYVRDYDSTKHLGFFGVRVLDTADVFDVDLVATNWTVTFWPRAGLIYSVSTGPTHGLWFAPLR